ncbi:hypothetical protein [Pedobacter jeongneungensis]|uniref:hypothetical protein n=1 Tax=Pedobacter jeongneungensis TaxID=947309 RepID=UPI0004688181|nr:hypothetical protein [Pedobacter jeongneungensis]
MSLFTKKPGGTVFGNLMRSFVYGGKYNHQVNISVADKKKSIELKKLEARSTNIDDLVRSQNLL